MAIKPLIVLFDDKTYLLVVVVSVDIDDCNNLIAANLNRAPWQSHDLGDPIELKIIFLAESIVDPEKDANQKGPIINAPKPANAIAMTSPIHIPIHRVNATGT